MKKKETELNEIILIGYFGKPSSEIYRNLKSPINQKKAGEDILILHYDIENIAVDFIVYRGVVQEIKCIHYFAGKALLNSYLMSLKLYLRKQGFRLKPSETGFNAENFNSIILCNRDDENKTITLINGKRLNN